jgi:hypothetical protein
MPGTKRVRLLVALALAASVLGACGGGSKLSRSDFLAKADALCTESNKTAPTAAPKNAKEAADQARGEVTARVELDAKLKALAPPGEISSQFDAYNSGTQKIINLVRLQQVAAERNQMRQYATLDKRREADSAARGEVGRRIGFKVCGQNIPQKPSKRP